MFNPMTAEQLKAIQDYADAQTAAQLSYSASGGSGGGGGGLQPIWTCAHCGGSRLDQDISVTSYEIGSNMQRNIKYCKDKIACKIGVDERIKLEQASQQMQPNSRWYLGSSGT